ncbi:MAG: tyrosine recombinase [Candidatus Omnitrophica bacterium]|nr:tyrosine recombinase [Candidatus Omnitrophota bacterium]
MKTPTELADYFLQHLRVERNLSKNTVGAYSADLKKFRAFMESDNYSLNRVDSEKITAFILFLKKQNLSSSTIVRTLSSVRNFYKFLAGHGFIKINSLPLIESPKVHRHLPEVLSKDEITLLIKDLFGTKDGIRNLAVIELIYGAGLRVSEITGIKTGDINFENNQIKITGKGNRERIVFLNRNSLAAVNSYLAVRAKKLRNSASPYLFVNSRGGKISRQSIWKLIKKMSAVSKLDKNVFPHTFRHSFATHLLESGLDLRIVQELLGHKTLATTEIYTHINKSQIKSVYKKFHPRSL